MPDSADTSLVGTALRSLPGIAFLMLVCLGFLGFLALPAVGNLLGPFVCDVGETMVDVQTSYSRPGESGTQVEYFCDGPSGRRPVDMFAMIKAALLFYAGFFLLVVWPLLSLRNYNGEKRIKRVKREGIPATIRILALKRTNVRINDMPRMKIDVEVKPTGHPEFTKTITKALPEFILGRLTPGKTIAGFVDPLNPTDVLIDLTGDVSGDDESSKPPGGDDLDALRRLKTMRDEELISWEEYTAKKAEIMDRM